MKHVTPSPLLTILRSIESETGKLTEAARMLSTARNFTLDGRLVGDIGEMLAAQHLAITLDDTQRRGHDGSTEIEGQRREVQIKCRKASTVISFTSIPDLLVVIAFSADWESWEFLYNGSGAPVRAEALTRKLDIDGESRIRSGGLRASLELSLARFRSYTSDDFPPISVPFRQEPVPIFPEVL